MRHTTAKTRVIREGESCGYSGCLFHAAEPCKGCGRIEGKGNIRLAEETVREIENSVSYTAFDMFIDFLRASEDKGIYRDKNGVTVKDYNNSVATKLLFYYSTESYVDIPYIGKEKKHAADFANWVALQQKVDIITNLEDKYCINRDTIKGYTTYELYDEWQRQLKAGLLEEDGSRVDKSIRKKP